MARFLRQHWFLTGLAILITAGMWLGVSGRGPGVKRATDLLPPQATTACVLFLMAFTLDTGRLAAAFRAPGPVLLGFALNYALLPTLGWLLMPLQLSADFRYGLMIACAVPSTTAAASVMTRKAGGNDAISLLTTLATNLSCFVLTPAWLYWTTAARVNLDATRLMLDLVLATLLPTLAGQLLRQQSTLCGFAVRHKISISVAAQILIELMVFTASLRAGMALAPGAAQTVTGTPPASVAAAAAHAVTPIAVLVVWGCAVAVHLAGFAAGWVASRKAGLAATDAAAVAFSGSQKTLPIGLYVSADPATYGSLYPLAMFPMLLFHASQLFLDTLLAGRLASTATESET